MPKENENNTSKATITIGDNSPLGCVLTDESIKAHGLKDGDEVDVIVVWNDAYSKEVE